VVMPLYDLCVEITTSPDPLLCKASILSKSFRISGFTKQTSLAVRRQRFRKCKFITSLRIFTCTGPVEVIMSNAFSLAVPLGSGPRSTQPTFLTGVSSWIPIHSVTAGISDARWLTVSNTVRWICLTLKNVSVLFGSPAIYEKCVKYKTL